MTDPIVARLVAWAGRIPEVRAVILTSTRARPEGSPDELSDWDVIVVLNDPSGFAEGDLGWHAQIGTPLVRWGDEDELLGHPTWFRGVVYEGGDKVDFTLWPDALLEAVAAADRLPPGLDHGYRVLYDPDLRTAGWPQPTFTAHLLRRPSHADYRALVEEFWWGTTYLAKAVRRGELFFASSFMLEHDLKLIALLRMLEWRAAARAGWRFAPGVYGRGIERHLDAPERRLLAATYASLDGDAIWRALDATVELFRTAAAEVADALGTRYPDEVDEGMARLLAVARAAHRGPGS